MSNLVSRRSALLTGAGAMFGLLAAKVRTAFGSAAATEAGERGVTSYRYDDFARPESELTDQSDVRRTTIYCYDEHGSLLSVIEPTACVATTTFRYDYDGEWR